MSTKTTLESTPGVPAGTIPATRSVTSRSPASACTVCAATPAQTARGRRADERAVPVHQHPWVDRARRDRVRRGRARRRDAGERPQQIDAENAQDLARERLAGARTDRERVLDRRRCGDDARECLHAQQRALVEAAPDAEHLQVHPVRDDVDAGRERGDRGRVREVDGQPDRDAERDGDERDERAQRVRAQRSGDERREEPAHRALRRRGRRACARRGRRSPRRRRCASPSGSPDRRRRCRAAASARGAGLRIEVSGRLVGEHDRRPVHDRARDRGALHLSAGELRGIRARLRRRARRSPAPRRRAAAISAAADALQHQRAAQRCRRRASPEAG